MRARGLLGRRRHGATSPPPPPGMVVLEDFATLRKVADGTQDLWRVYLPADADQTLSLGTTPGGTDYLRVSVGPSIWFTGTATAGTTASLTDSTQDWSATNMVVSGVPAAIKFTSGPNAGQVRALTGNSAHAVTWSTPLGSAAAAGDAYAITYIGSVNLEFEPNGDADGYIYPNGYMQHYVKSGTFDPACNRMTFWVRFSKDIAPRGDGDEVFEFGTYVRQKDDNGTVDQGNHYYHLSDPNARAGRWIKVVLTSAPQHLVGHAALPPLDPEFQAGYFASDWLASGVSATNGSATISAAAGTFTGLAGSPVTLASAFPPYPYGLTVPYTIASVNGDGSSATLATPFSGATGSYFLLFCVQLPTASDLGTRAPLHYFDGMTRLYFACQYPNLVSFGQWYDLDVDFADFRLSTVSGEPDDRVSTVLCTYTGTAYELRWAARPDVATAFDIYYSAASMHANGIGSGTLAGTMTNASGLVLVSFTTPPMSEQSSIYFAIRPQGGDGTFHELLMTTRT